MKGTIIVGIDCATLTKNTGLALADAGTNPPRVLVAELGSDSPSVPARIASWIGTAERVLLALDAPLGWPAPLGDALSPHVAGDYVGDNPDGLFRRYTDRAVREHVGKRPLEVGADRIARTAVAALRLLEEVRAVTKQPIPLAWSHDLPGGISAIEVYPAATLSAYELPATGYKKRSQEVVRKQILEGLGAHMQLPSDVKPLQTNADILDACVCVLAGLDFLAGRAIPPTDMRLAQKEGWIWVC